MNKDLREKIEQIIIKHKELGYLKSEEDCVDQLLSLFQEEMLEIIGENELSPKVKPDNKYANSVVERIKARNTFRARIRAKLEA